MSKRVQVITVPRDATMPAENITGPEWTAAQSQIANASSLAELADTRVFDVRKYGDLGTADDSATIQAAIDDASSTGATVTMPTGDYALAQPLSLGNARLDLNGSVLDFSGSTLPALSMLVTASGSVSSMPSLASSVGRWADTMTFASAHGLAVGDWFCVYNPEDSSFSQSRAYYRDGMWFQVVEVVSSTQVRTRQKSLVILPLTCVISKMNPVTGGISNGTIRGKKGSNYYGYVARFTAGTQVENLTVSDCEYTGVSISRSVDFVVTNVTAHAPMDTVAAQDHYGILIANSQHGLVYGNNVLAQSHAIVIGGGSDSTSVPNRWINVENNIITTTGSKSALDSHGNAEYYSFKNNIIHGGITAGGDNAVIESNEINVRTGPPISITTEACGTNFSILKNKITMSTQWETANGGAINIFFTTSGYTSLPTVTRDNGHLEIRGNTFDCGGFIPSDSTSLGSLVQIYFVNVPAIGTRITFVDNRLSSTVGTGTMNRYEFLTVRTGSNASIRSLDVTNNDFGAAGLYTLNADIQTIRVKDNLFQNSVYEAIYLRMDASSMTYAKPIVEIAGNIVNTTYANAVWVSGASDGAQPAICTIRNNTIINGNGRGDSGTSTGAGVRVTYCDVLMMVGNVWGDNRSTPLQTRRLSVGNVGVLARSNNETVGTVTTDTLVNIGTDRAPE